jgi:hypothetical protein
LQFVFLKLGKTVVLTFRVAVAASIRCHETERSADWLMAVDSLDMTAFDRSIDDEHTQTRSSSPDTTSSTDAFGNGGAGAGCGGSLVKRPWTPEEDTALVAAVHKYGACRWSMIATQLSTGRVGKQCRERWNNHLCPEVKKTEWSEEEDRAILQGVAVLGTRWCEIIKTPALSGRTDNAIKNRFYSLQRKMKARQAGGLRRRRQHPAAGQEETAPAGLAERVVAIATELAFATDETDRDRLIEQLTATLHEGDESSGDLDDLGELGGELSELDGPGESLGQQLDSLSSQLGFANLPSTSLDLAKASSADVAELLKLDLDAHAMTGTEAPGAGAAKLHTAGSEPTELSGDTSSSTSTISPDGAGGVAMLQLSAWAMSTAGSIADQLPALVEESALDLSPTASVDDLIGSISSRSAQQTLRAKRSLAACAISEDLGSLLGAQLGAQWPSGEPPIEIAAEIGSVRAVQLSLPPKRTQPHERTREEHGVSFGGKAAAAAAARAATTQVLRETTTVFKAPGPGQVLNMTPVFKAPCPGQVLAPAGMPHRALSPRAPAAAAASGAPPCPPNVSASCLGGRHAYRAMLAPLRLPVEPPGTPVEAIDSPKRQRTATGHVAGGAPSSELPAGDRISPIGVLKGGRKIGAKSPLGGPPTPLEEAAAAVARAGLAIYAATTGTEEPGAAAPFADLLSPVSELLNVSLFNDLFGATPTEPTSHGIASAATLATVATATTAAAVPSPATKPAVVIAVPTKLPSPPCGSGRNAMTPAGGPLQTTVARASPTGGRGGRRSTRQAAECRVTFAEARASLTC